LVLDPLINEGPELLAIESHIGFLSVHDKSRILENPVPDLLPKPQWRLSLDDLETNPVAVEAGNLGDATAEVVQSLFPVFRIFFVARSPLFPVQAQCVENQIARWACHFETLKGGRDHFNGYRSHQRAFLGNLQ
jgi:hypothetical protein